MTQDTMLNEHGTIVSLKVDGVELDAIDFGASWRESDLAAVGSMRGCRVVGQVQCRLDVMRDPLRSLRSGLLLRHIASKSYRLVGPFGQIDLPGDATEGFLQRVRQGHHGGPGRCQGILSDDGFCYPRPVSVTLPRETVRWATRYGRGVFSMGLRRMAGVVQEQLGEDGSLVDAPRQALKPGSAKRCKAYLDEESIRRFRAWGAGNLSGGIRLAHQQMILSR